jgi:hypothetical protein
MSECNRNEQDFLTLALHDQLRYPSIDDSWGVVAATFTENEAHA